MKNPAISIHPFIFAVLAMAFWGMTFIWVKIVLEEFRPVTILLLRLTISSLLLWIFVIITNKFQQIKKKDIPIFALTALFQPFFYFIGETYGVSYVSSTLGSVMVSTIPIVTPLGAWIFLKEKLGWINFAAFIFSFVGVLLMIFAEESSGTNSFKGAAFLAFGVMAAVGSAVIIKKLTVKYNSFTIVTVQNSIGLIYFIPLFFILDYPDVLNANPDIRIWRNVIALAIFGSTLAFIFFTNVIRVLGVNKASIFSNMIPVFTAIFALIILNENFSLQKIAGMLIVITGVLIVQIVSRSKTGIAYRHIFRKKNSEINNEDV